jgi:hypothetical protein
MRLFIRDIVPSAFAILGLSSAAFAQGITFLQPVDNLDLTPEQSATLSRVKSQPTTEDVQIVRVNPQALAVNDQILVRFKSQAQLAIRSDEKLLQADKLVGWSGAAQDALARSTTMVVNEDNVTASIQAANGPYSIQPLGGGLHALVKVDTAKMPPEHPPFFKEKPHSRQDVFPFTPQLNTSATPTTISVLVAYTPAVKSAIGDIDGSVIDGLAQLGITHANASYKNSGININLVAAPAHPLLVNLNETGNMDVEISAFAAMPTVQSARAANHSNVAVLLLADRSACGESQKVFATKETAFSVVYYNCVYNNYSLAHEIGHLQGARHNPEDDAESSPFAYGHGFVDQSRKRRTIMAYDCPGGCTRELQWARPTDWGNSTVSNDARVLNETATYIAGFR